MKKVIITGTPGAGKTTLLNALHTLGIPHVAESATHIIHQQQQLGVAQPWLNPNFITQLTHHQVQQHNTTINSPVLLFDRSIFCTYALCLLLKHPIPNTLKLAINQALQQRTFNATVIFVQNLGYITPTPARKISYTNALLFEALHQYVYTQFGFNLVYIPKASIAKRLNYIQAILNQL